MYTDTHDNLDLTPDAAPDGRAGLSAGDRQWAAAAHFAPLLAALITSWFAGVAGVIAALVVWLLARDRSAFAAEHARDALNFNLSMFLYVMIGIVFAVFTLGIGLLIVLPMWLVLGLAWVVLSIVAGFKAYDGEQYRYPLTIRFV